MLLVWVFAKHPSRILVFCALTTVFITYTLKNSPFLRHVSFLFNIILLILLSLAGTIIYIMKIRFSSINLFVIFTVTISTTVFVIMILLSGVYIEENLILFGIVLLKKCGRSGIWHYPLESLRKQWFYFERF